MGAAKRPASKLNFAVVVDQGNICGLQVTIMELPSVRKFLVVCIDAEGVDSSTVHDFQPEGAGPSISSA